MMFGGDNWHVEETYGTIRLMRRLIGEVLQEKVDAGYFRPADARRPSTTASSAPRGEPGPVRAGDVERSTSTSLPS